MATTKVKKYVNVLDVFWDGWLNNFKMFQSIQNRSEEKSLQAFESQKEWIQSTRDQLSQLKEDSKKLTTKWQSDSQDILNSAQNEFDIQNLFKWANRFEALRNIPIEPLMNCFQNYMHN